MNLQYVKAEWSKKTDMPLTISLMKSKHKCELYFGNYEDWSKWKKALRKLVLVNDYKSVYKNCKIISKGQ